MPIDFLGIARALAERADDVTAALLGEPSQTSRHEHRWGRHGSFSLRLSGTKRGLWFDHERGEGGDMLLLIARQRQVGLSEAVAIAHREFLGSFATAKRAVSNPALPQSQHSETRIAVALRLWSEAVTINHSFGERYFVEHRKLDISQLDVSHALKWHANTRALVAIMTDPVTGDASGVHRTFLDRSANKAGPENAWPSRCRPSVTG